MIRPNRLEFHLLFSFLLCSGTLFAQVSTYRTNDNPNSPEHHYPGVRDTLLRNGVFSHRIRTDSVFYDDQLTFVNKDTAVFFLNSMGSRLSEIPCAAFYRVAPLNRYYQQSGLVTDYYLDNDSVAARLSYDNAVLDGPCWFYFRNGLVREKGIYTKNARRGIWDFYFENGQKEKSVQYTDSGVYLIDCFSKDAQTLAHEGNGRFEGTVLTGNYSSTTELKIVGSVKEGLPDGEWKLYSKFLREPLFVEQFSSGRFIRGVSTAIRLTKDYDQNPISTVAGVEPVEAMDYYAHNDFCRLAGKK
ncbi:toxin-antitoxin system YwqK family antitoxin [Puia sp. P3]|uniref:toxin-antitoxin system YwqK family antitoxin n=1 Tax=Puia sp. P3 TaxID=3423952 RepID=UPI003D667A33